MPRCRSVRSAEHNAPSHTTQQLPVLLGNSLGGHQHRRPVSRCSDAASEPKGWELVAGLSTEVALAAAQALVVAEGTQLRVAARAPHPPPSSGCRVCVRANGAPIIGAAVFGSGRSCCGALPFDGLGHVFGCDPRWLSVRLRLWWRPLPNSGTPPFPLEGATAGGQRSAQWLDCRRTKPGKCLLQASAAGSGRGTAAAAPTGWIAGGCSGRGALLLLLLPLRPWWGWRLWTPNAGPRALRHRRRGPRRRLGDRPGEPAAAPGRLVCERVGHLRKQPLLIASCCAANVQDADSLPTHHHKVAGVGQPIVLWNIRHVQVVFADNTIGTRCKICPGADRTGDGINISRTHGAGFAALLRLPHGNSKSGEADGATRAPEESTKKGCAGRAGEQQA
mmetsp:Transcript_136007/g.352640  ORF Transcript_136007/g.352640 Transcript_136007/m.352640 type:complete len:391 (+) Transcript_136007:306-1478(+)